MRLEGLSRLAAQLEGVSEGRRDGLLELAVSRTAGGPAARRPPCRDPCDLRFRDFLLHSFPEPFSVPERFAKHMMIVADLEQGNADAIEDAVIGAWELQSRN